MAALVDEYQLKDLEELLYKKRNELGKRTVISIMGPEDEPETKESMEAIARLVGGRDDAGMAKGREAVNEARKKLRESHAKLFEEINGVLPDYGKACRMLRESGDKSISDILDSPKEKYLDMYLLGREAVNSSIGEEKHHEVKKYVDALKFLIPLHNKVDLVEELYGENDASKDIDYAIHGKIRKVFDNLIAYAEGAGFSEATGSLKYILGRKRSERGFPPIKWKELLDGFKNGYKEKAFYEDLYERASNWLRYQLSIKEFRDMRILVRREPTTLGLVDVIALYEIERGPGDIVHGLSIYDDVDEKKISRAIPNPSPEYGTGKFMSKREVAVISGTAITSYILESTPSIAGKLSAISLHSLLGLDIPLLGDVSALNALKIFSVAPSPAKSILFYSGVFGGKKLYDFLKTYMEKRTVKDILKSLAAHYDVDSIYALATEVGKQQSLKANLCYAAIWGKGDQEIDYTSLYRETKKCGLEEMETNMCLKTLKSKGLVKDTGSGYIPSGMRMQFIGHQIDMPLEVDNVLEAEVDELVGNSSMREPQKKHKDYVGSSIHDYRGKAGMLDEEIRYCKSKNIDVSAAESALSELKSELDESDAYRNRGDYFNAYLSLRGLKILLNNAATEYDEIKKLQPKTEVMKNC